MIRKSIVLIVATGLFLMNSTMSLAAYPDRPVKVVIPFAAGGGADIVGRLVFQKLSLVVDLN